MEDTFSFPYRSPPPAAASISDRLVSPSVKEWSPSKNRLKDNQPAPRQSQRVQWDDFSSPKRDMGEMKREEKGDGKRSRERLNRNSVKNYGSQKGGPREERVSFSRRLTFMGSEAEEEPEPSPSRAREEEREAALHSQIGRSFPSHRVKENLLCLPSSLRNSTERADPAHSSLCSSLSSFCSSSSFPAIHVEEEEQEKDASMFYSLLEGRCDQEERELFNALPPSQALLSYKEKLDLLSLPGTPRAAEASPGNDYVADCKRLREELTILQDRLQHERDKSGKERASLIREAQQKGKEADSLHEDVMMLALTAEKVRCRNRELNRENETLREENEVLRREKVTEREQAMTRLQEAEAANLKVRGQLEALQRTVQEQAETVRRLEKELRLQQYEEKREEEEPLGSPPSEVRKRPLEPMGSFEDEERSQEGRGSEQWGFMSILSRAFAPSLQLSGGEVQDVVSNSDYSSLEPQKEEASGVPAVKSVEKRRHERETCRRRKDRRNETESRGEEINVSRSRDKKEKSLEKRLSSLEKVVERQAQHASRLEESLFDVQAALRDRDLRFEEEGARLRLMEAQSLRLLQLLGEKAEGRGEEALEVVTSRVRELQNAMH